MPTLRTMVRIANTAVTVLATIVAADASAQLRQVLHVTAHDERAPGSRRATAGYTSGMAHSALRHAQAQPDLATFPFDIVPGRRFGPIAENTSRVALTAVAPANAIRESAIEIGEGFCTEGVRLFPDTDDEVEVAWQDVAQTRVAFVRTRRPGGRWHTTGGVRIGTLLSDLERLANRVLTFSGFGWDYGGGATWTEGSGEIGLRLDIDRAEAAKATAPNADDIYGDRTVRSDHPVVRTLRVRVDEIIQTWGQHASERDCR